MPTITLQPAPGFAHCRDPFCPGNEQEPVGIIVEKAETSYMELGGDMPGVQNSTNRFLFADETEIDCPHCGEYREVSDQVRPIYPVMTSQLNATTTDQRFLLELKKLGKIINPGEASGAGDSNARDEELATLRREIAELRGFLAGQQSVQPAPPAETPPAEPRRRGRSKPAPESQGD